jgi:predicted RNA-binding protein with PIN domain
MTTKAKVKVIKKGEVKNAEQPTIVEKKSTKIAAREMVSTVSNWVNDFQQRRREETKQALETFLSSTPKTSEL